MLLRFNDGTAWNKGQSLDNNVNQTHLVLASGKLVLQKQHFIDLRPNWFNFFSVAFYPVHGGIVVDLLPVHPRPLHRQPRHRHHRPHQPEPAAGFELVPPDGRGQALGLEPRSHGRHSEGLDPLLCRYYQHQFTLR